MSFMKKWMIRALSSVVVLMGTTVFASEEAEMDAFFIDPPNEFRIVRYGLTNSRLAENPQYGFGGYKAFFYNNLYKDQAGGIDAIGPLVDAANEQGRKVWCSDDNGYPSGSAGGQVVEGHPEYEARGVAMLSTSGSGQVPVSIVTPNDCEKMVSAVLYPVSGGTPDYTQGQVQSVLDTGVSTTGLAGDWKLCAFVLQIRDSNTQAQTNPEQFGSTGHYPDLLNSNAVARWISLVHEPVLAEITDPASLVEGFYFNEPSLMQLNWDTTAPYACLSWNDGLFDKFLAMHGYDLRPVMAALYERDELFAKRVRMHFHQTIAEMLRTSFTGQIADWCAARGIVASGHPLIEESLQIHVANFGDMLKVISEMQVPAVDLPMPEPDRMAGQNYHFPKLMSSMGSYHEQDPRVMGLIDPVIDGYGNRLDPSEDVICNTINRAVGSGVNKFASYINPQWYEDPANPFPFVQVNEYAGRISTMLTGARIASSVALYYPIEMFQSEYKPTRNTHWGIWEPARQVAWDNLQSTMLNADVDYNIVHPEWLRDAAIEDGELKIGSGSYRYLVMPDVEIISSNVMARIQQFEAAGGTVLWVGNKPSAGYYPTEDAAVTAAVAGMTTVSAAQVPGLIQDPYGDAFKLQVAPGQILTTRFNRSGRSLYFLVNPSGAPITVQLDYGGGSGTLKVCDPVTGEITVESQSVEVVIDGYRSLLVFSDPHPSLSVADGSFEYPTDIVGDWGMCPASWNDALTGQYEVSGDHFTETADGHWAALMSNLGTIHQDLGSVNQGEILTVVFHAGRAASGKNTADGGVVNCTLKVGGASHTVQADTTQFAYDSWKAFTNSWVAPESGALTLEFTNVSGNPWIDHVSDVVVESVTTPTGLIAELGQGIGGIFLDWDDHPDDDFESYTVYRSIRSGGGYEQIASGLGDSEFSDDAAAPGLTYYYVVVAKDVDGDSSLFSSEVSIELPKPNVIMILIDDMGWADSSTYGSTYYQTPNLTRLAEEGMLFTDAYAASPLCSPTRASILSGQYPARLRVTTAITGGDVPEPQALESATNEYCGDVENRNHMPLEVNTLAETLKLNGYHTAHIGKWHLAPHTNGSAFYAEHQGFDWVIGGDERAGPPDYYSPYNIRNLANGPDGEYLNERLAEESIQWIDSVKDSDQPFFLNFWHYAVHGPIIAKEDLMPKYEALRDPDNPQRCPEMATMLESMDNSVGILLDWLDLPENAELKANTMIVLTSDNGGVTHKETENGDTWTSNRPLRGGKANTYEGGIRVPWIVRWPGRVGAGTINATPVQTIDIYPTVLEAAGIAPPAGTVLDGQSIVAVLNGTSTTHQPVFTDFPHIFGILCAPSACVRDVDWKLIRFYHAGEDAEAHAYELYDLALDPAETVNLAAYFPVKVAELDLLIDAHLIDTDALTPIASTSYTGSAIDVPRGSAVDAPNRPVSLRLQVAEIQTAVSGTRMVQLLDQDNQLRTTHAFVLEGKEWVSVENRPDGSVQVQWTTPPAGETAKLLFGWKGGSTTREINDWTFASRELLIGPKEPVTLSVVDGSFENPTNVVGSWGMCSAVWNDASSSQYEVGRPGHLSSPVDGNWAALMNNVGTIHQEVGNVNAGDTLTVVFYGGRAEAIKNTAAGGVFNCSLKVGSASHTVQVDTTQFAYDTWEAFTNSWVATESGTLTLEFSNVSGSPWIDSISDVTVVPAAPVLTDSPEASFQFDGEGQAEFTVETTAGVEYRVVYKNELTSADEWLPITPPLPDGWTNGSGEPILISDPESITEPQRFYRIEARTSAGE